MSGTWRPNPPASSDAIEALQRDAPARLPDAYVEQLSSSNGGEGDIALEPGWVCFWSAEDVLAFNAEYSVAELLPGFLGFGSSGDGELIAFDLRSGSPYPIVAVPFIPMDADRAIEIAATFDEFREKLGHRLEPHS